MLQLSTDGKRERWIDQTHPIFEDTDFIDAKFRIKIKPVSRTDISRATTANTKVVKGLQRCDDVMMQRDLFVKCVVDWQDIGDHNGQPIECNEANKRVVADQNVTFSSLVTDAAIAFQKEVEKNTKDEIKN